VSSDVGLCAGRHIIILLGRMWHVARSVVCVVCVLGIRISCAKTAEPIEMPFEGPTQTDPRNHVLAGGQHRTNPFATARGDKAACRDAPFWTLVLCVIQHPCQSYFCFELPSVRWRADRRARKFDI